MELKTFVISTSGKPEDVIIYTSNSKVVKLDNLAGSNIVSLPPEEDEPIDGGSF